YLLKDISSRELINAIKTVYRGEAVLHPTIARKVLERYRQTKERIEKGPELDSLTERETAVLKLAAKGMSNSE
ncbi:MAG: response regulator transcription factor, partial [Desulfobacterales bacterium]|nr:response regulator transcription factor [Desulfobacterales bacterium]